MEKKYIVKEFGTNKYYCGEDYGWREETFLAEMFDSRKKIEALIIKEEGTYEIIKLYISK